jgi:pimeloyl-ACP methyl ester carboxylesterase
MINRSQGDAGGYYYPDHFKLEAEVVAVVDALKLAYAEILPAKPWLYAGYSQGATMGALRLPAHGELFSRVILVEGGFDSWTTQRSKQFKANGGERVALVCGRKGCAQAATRSITVLNRAEVMARSLYAAGAGHTYLGGVAQSIAEVLPWLLEP